MPGLDPRSPYTQACPFTRKLPSLVRSCSGAIFCGSSPLYRGNISVCSREVLFLIFLAVVFWDSQAPNSLSVGFWYPSPLGSFKYPSVNIYWFSCPMQSKRNIIKLHTVKSLLLYDTICNHSIPTPTAVTYAMSPLGAAYCYLRNRLLAHRLKKERTPRLLCGYYHPAHLPSSEESLLAILHQNVLFLVLASALYNAVLMLMN